MNIRNTIRHEELRQIFSLLEKSGHFDAYEETTTDRERLPRLYYQLPALILNKKGRFLRPGEKKQHVVILAEDYFPQGRYPHAYMNLAQYLMQLSDMDYCPSVFLKSPPYFCLDKTRPNYISIELPNRKRKAQDDDALVKATDIENKLAEMSGNNLTYYIARRMEHVKINTFLFRNVSSAYNGIDDVLRFADPRNSFASCDRGLLHSMTLDFVQTAGRTSYSIPCDPRELEKSLGITTPEQYALKI